MSRESRALLVAAGTAVVGFLVVFYIAQVIIGLVVVLAALGAAAAAGIAGHNYVMGRPLGERPWRNRRG